MSAAPDIVRDAHGVILHYADPTEPRAHHRAQRFQVSDRRRTKLIEAERELLTLRIIAEHLDLSDIALTRIFDALSTIRGGLNSLRPEYGMAQQGFDG